MTTLSTPASAAARLNGIDLEALRGAIAAITQDPAKGQTHWRVTSRWMGGTRTDHAIEHATIGGAPMARSFVLKVDEPFELCGTNQHPNPQEVLLSAINACMMVGYSAVAALMGIRLTRLEVELSGDIDLRGFLGIDARVTPGYERLKQTVRIAAEAPREALERLHAVVKATSPNYFNITHAVPTASELVIG